MHRPNMSMAKRLRSDDEKKRADEPLPVDPLLEILARSDARTIVRCAATSTAVRQTVLGHDFRGRLALRAEASGGFDPALLLGVSYVLRIRRNTAAVACQHGEQHLRFDPSLFRSHEHVASRDCFVVLRRWETPAAPGDPPTPGDLYVCNSLTGETYRLPPAVIGSDGAYPPALLTDDSNGRSFRLLTADRNLRTETFSSTDDTWGPVLQTHYMSQQPYFFGEEGEYASRPIVLGGDIIHWLRLSRQGYDYKYRKDPHIIALHVGSAQATRIELPSECISRMRCLQDVPTGLQLAASPTAKLAVLVAEILGISMWTILETETEDTMTPTWVRWVVIKWQAIGLQPWSIGNNSFLGFGQRSGMVLLEVDGVGLVRLNLGTKDVVILHREPQKSSRFNPMQMCLHEINLSSLLQAMGSPKQ